MKFRLIMNPNDPAKRSVHDASNFNRNDFGPGTYVIGLDGKVYENYGSVEVPVWDEIFDSYYEIEMYEDDGPVASIKDLGPAGKKTILKDKDGTPFASQG